MSDAPKDRLRKVLDQLPLDSTQRLAANAGIKQMEKENASKLLGELETALDQFPNSLALLDAELAHFEATVASGKENLAARTRLESAIGPLPLDSVQRATAVQGIQRMTAAKAITLADDINNAASSLPDALSRLENEVRAYEHHIEADIAYVLEGEKSSWHSAVTQNLAASGYIVEKIGSDSPQRRNQASLVVTDLDLKKAGIEILHQLRKRTPDIAIVAVASSNLTVAATWCKELAVSLVHQDVLDIQLSQVVTAQREARLSRLVHLLGSSSTWLDTLRIVERVSATETTMLLTGETGTGKSLIAQEIHRRSRRATQPFVTINCGALLEALLESELFGHRSGAFPGATHDRPGMFQAANGGTLFLDDVGDLPADLQSKLLGVLESRIVTPVGDTTGQVVDVRIVAASNRNLADEVGAGRFLEALYYRLGVINLHVPALRDRQEDVLVVARCLLSQIAKRYRAEATGFSSAAEAAMRIHDWPGNVRELENRIERALVLAEGDLLTPDDMGLTSDVLPTVHSLAEAQSQFQQKYVLDVFEMYDRDKDRVATVLGLEVTKLQQLLIAIESTIK